MAEDQKADEQKIDDTPVVDDTPADDETPDDASAEKAAAKEPDAKERARIAFEERQKRIKEENEKLKKENADYKRREDERRREKLTQEEREKEELEALRAENSNLKTQQLRDKIAAEFKLPPALASRITGTDEQAMRDDAEELSKYVPKRAVGTPTNPAGDGTLSGVKTYKKSEIRTPEIAEKVRKELAAGQCRVIEG